MLGMLICVGIAILIIALIASPSFREGERFFTPEGEERVQNMRRRAVEDATRGREAVRSVVNRRRPRDAEDESAGALDGPSYRVEDVDGYEENQASEDRDVRLADRSEPGLERNVDHERDPEIGRRPMDAQERRFEPGDDPRERVASTGAQPGRSGRERLAPERRDVATRDRRDDDDAPQDEIDLRDSAVNVRDAEPVEPETGHGRVRRSGASPAAAGVVVGGAVAGGATAIGAVKRRRSGGETASRTSTPLEATVDAPREDREASTRFDLPAVSRHEEAYETDRPLPQDDGGSNRGRRLGGAGGGRSDAGDEASRVAPVGDEWEGDVEPDERAPEPAYSGAEPRGEEGGFMARITSSLNRSGTDRTRTGPRHARG